MPQTPTQTSAGTGSFNDSFKKLRQIAQQLQQQQSDPNIDALVNMVEEAVEHYQVCKTRIDAVEKLIREKLEPLTQEEADSDEDIDIT